MAGEKILIVDDERLVLATLGEGLRQAGYDVEEAASGEEALRLIEDNVPDLAILDMRMPGMSGVDVARWLKLHGDVPFLFLSAYSDAVVVERAVEEGALGYLVKPLDVPQIVPSIEAALARAREFRKLNESRTHLSTALSQSRETSVAVGLAMERYRVGEQQAFEMLRATARSHRRKLVDVAQEIVSAAEILNRPFVEQSPSSRPVSRKSTRGAVRGSSK
ncbi:MAG: response regulator [Gammaproteobacteria bacterium]